VYSRLYDRLSRVPYSLLLSIVYEQHIDTNRRKSTRLLLRYVRIFKRSITRTVSHHNLQRLADK